ncbi:alpha/beta hydrolase [Phytomonospora endophytica]|uniref:Pimeloyl-ACP methyl ester carboxylesterase n=1 Tax=Phytomonospora endophytica TaxID=714109 RepID=A0A841FEZ8_9ACTN|nr:alpha/beta fold hydrolase [Phytomonospora endophytica]MBB6034846.1 pimeloyl-ACP methyl ester carboxylesterase [Phytomonospora endophytica]GIG68950.1 esterase [Phytomonospora endophytica]
MERRGLLHAGTALAATALTTTVASPAHAARRRPTFVLVHGANGNGYSFAPLAAELALAGFGAVPVDLPGHGPAANYPASYQSPQDLAAFADAPSPTLAGTALADNADHVAGIVRRAAAHGPVILLGQSMGGATVTLAADRVPGLITRLVYLSAFCCTAFRSVADAFGSPEAAGSLLGDIPPVGDPARTGVLRTNWRAAEVVAPAKAALAADYDEAAFGAVLNGFEPDEAAAVATDDARGDRRRWGRVPRTYVRFTADRAIPLALQDRMIADADAATPGNRFTVHSLRAPHLGPQDAAVLMDVLAGLA